MKKDLSNKLVSANVKRLARDTRGANFGEYAILFGFIVLVVAGAVKAFGGSLSGKINEMGTSVGQVNSTLGGSSP